jgi:polyisoprenoid-binding protein YceI
MRATHLAALAVAIACVSLAPASAAQTHPIDPAKSKAQFRIAHIFVSRVTGTIPILRGEVALDEGATIPSAVTATLDAAHVDSGDRDRDASLESSDYFDTQKFPEWTFASTKITPTGPAAFGLDGTLTIHGVAQPEHLDVTVTGDAKSPQYHATGRIDRHAFGMKGARLDPVIGKDADVTLDIVLSR